jgi:predicted nucleic acid-binding protein
MRCHDHSQRTDGGLPKDPAELLVPTTVQHELSKWVKRESDKNTALDAIALADDGLVVPLSTDIALVAADLTLFHKLAFADAVIYASARKYNVDLVTPEHAGRCDATPPLARSCCPQPGLPRGVTCRGSLPSRFVQQVFFVIPSVVQRTYVMSAGCDTARRQGPGFILILRIPAFSVMDAELSARAKKMAPHLLDNAQTRPRLSTSLAASPCSYMRSW